MHARSDSVKRLFECYRLARMLSIRAFCRGGRQKRTFASAARRGIRRRVDQDTGEPWRGLAILAVRLPSFSMPTIAIKRRHKLEPKKAKAAAQKVIKDLSARYQLACSWDGDQVQFERSGVSGRMHLGKNEILLDVQLSFLMTPLKSPIERAINEELDRLFGDTA
ncbi:MAG: polyhydroxyalkanoic acid system family protein [Betaproteobacteria bacterium]